VLRKQNPYQTRIKFIEQWIGQKLIHGRVPILKSRDNRGVVRELRVLDPLMVDPLVSESGAVFYRLKQNRLAGIDSDIVVPAREIIYDVHFTPEHPLVGVSPIGACGLAATQGLKIQRNSTKFFGNMSRPSFVLTAPGAISDATATRLKDKWEQNFGGENYGRTAILGDGLEPKAFTLTAEDSQLIQQLGWTGEDVCRAFGVPAYKIGFGQMPAFNNVEALDQAYYSQCLQELIECVEAHLDEGLELPPEYGVELDLDGLLRMDSKTRAEVDKTEISAGILAPNEARAKRNLLPVKGGESPYLQQQN
jgi:HK97 family phage portal protein